MSDFPGWCQEGHPVHRSFTPFTIKKVTGQPRFNGGNDCKSV